LNKPLTIGLAAAASIAGVLSMIMVDGSERAPATIVTEAAAAEPEPAVVVVRMAQHAPVSPLYVLEYERGPRIIHVPQPGERASHRAAVRPVSRTTTSHEPDGELDEDEIREAAPAPPAPPAKKKVRVIPMQQQQASVPAPAPDKAPRWKMRNENPPASGPKRAVLSAPPLGAEGPTPIRPTPRFEVDAEGAARFASPIEAAPQISDPEPPLPPLGYSPPATPLPVD
jgi:hypothetical protein